MLNESVRVPSVRLRVSVATHHWKLPVTCDLSFQTLKAQTLTLEEHGDDDAIVMVVVRICSLSARTISLRDIL